MIAANFQTKIPSSLVWFWGFFLSIQVAKAPKTSAGTPADIWVLSYKYLLVVSLVQGMAFYLKKAYTRKRISSTDVLVNLCWTPLGCSMMGTYGVLGLRGLNGAFAKEIPMVRLLLF